MEIFKRYAAAPRRAARRSELPAEVAAMVERQAAKRVGLEFVERRRASWDHRKLGGDLLSAWRSRVDARLGHALA